MLNVCPLEILFKSIVMYHIHHLQAVLFCNYWLGFVKLITRYPKINTLLIDYLYLFINMNAIYYFIYYLSNKTV